MADLIDRAALLAAGDATKMTVAFEDWSRLDWKTQQHILNFSRAFKRLVEYAPAVDAVPVVRCKNCRWYKVESESCGFWPDEGYRDPEHFCGEGKRRKDADN